MSYQGKRKNQVMFSEQAVFYSIIGVLALLLIIIISK